jgi:hypothetical protein
LINGRERASNGYSRKEIFTTKLNGEPFDVLRKNLAKDMEWLIEYEIFSDKGFNKHRECIYVCKYPIRIWYTIGKLPYTQSRRDWLTPGDIYQF